MVHKYCWRVVVTFRCGCVESPPTTHLCGPGRQDCDAWVTRENINKDCEGHRLGWGLQQSASSSSFSSSLSSSSSADASRHKEGDSGHSIGAGPGGTGGGGDAGGAEGGDENRQWHEEMGRRRMIEGDCGDQGTTWEGCYVRRRI
ncbi:hypothetical protein C8A03DRAFT_35734 [Achaetomium macrosporum]|uniref:Uncharacterized protein n=1 Tax=Achaetomium macrosporum TaxID=79813 RepID=A0AAN7HCL7_9PEZI|nr:hypothetical protein C8A03DRAFT_35734 [Achaetomium macrosporum]